MLTQKYFTFAIRSVMGNFWGYQIGLNRENESNLNKKSYGLTLILALQRASLTRKDACCVLAGDLTAPSAIRTLLLGGSVGVSEEALLSELPATPLTPIRSPS